MLRSLKSLCFTLPTLLVLANGCSLSSNKAFSWLKPKPTSSSSLAVEKAPASVTPVTGKADAVSLAAANTNLAIADETKLAAENNVVTNNPPAQTVAANLGAGLIAPASKRLTPIQRDLNGFQSFPFDIDMVDVSGRPVRLQDLRGKVVIVDLWGTWCGPCRRVIPHLVKLQQNHSQDLQVIGLCNERTADTRAAKASLSAAMAEFGINYPCILIDDKVTRKVPNFSGYPTMLFIDRAGKVRMSTVGVKPEAYWDSLVAELIAS